jgi:hypothetical protein
VSGLGRPHRPAPALRQPLAIQPGRDGINLKGMKP